MTRIFEHDTYIFFSTYMCICRSNEWQGSKTFAGKCLHDVGPNPNQYEMAMSTIARTLAPFDDDKLIPVYGFGDVATTDRDCFSFFNNGRPAHGLDEALFRYRELAPHVNLSGAQTSQPTLLLLSRLHMCRQSYQQICELSYLTLILGILSLNI